MCKTKCPHCKYEFNDEEIWHGANDCDFPLRGDGDTDYFICPSCSETLYVTVNHDISWKFTNDDGNELDVETK